MMDKSDLVAELVSILERTDSALWTHKTENWMDKYKSLIDKHKDYTVKKFHSHYKAMMQEIINEIADDDNGSLDTEFVCDVFTNYYLLDDSEDD